MKKYLNFRTMTPKQFARVSRIGVVIAAVLLVMLLIRLSPLTLRHVVLISLIAFAIIAAIYSNKRFSWRSFARRIGSIKIRLGRGKKISTPLRYYTRDELSPLTVEYSGLTDKELEQVLYDEHHYWGVTLLMILNPFWSRDHDVQPRVKTDFAEAKSGAINNLLVGFIRMLTRAAQIGYIVIIIGLLVSVLLRNRNVVLGSFQFASINVDGLFVLLTLLTIIWVAYMSRVARGCRLIVTEWNIILLVRQLPWRDNSRLVIQYRLYASSTPDQSLAGKIFGFIDLAISTTDPEEPLAGWIKARNPAKLKAVMGHWDVRKRNEQQRKYEELTKLQTPEDLDDTQEIPVVNSPVA